MLILTVLQGPDKGRRFELPDDEPQLIGRSSEALPITDRSISRRHAELTPDSGDWYLNDLHSANGTFVNGLKLVERRLLKPGDQVRTGATLFVFGQEVKQLGHSPVRVARPNEMDANLEVSVASNDETMIPGGTDPRQAAAVQLKVIYELTQLVGTIVDRQHLLERVMDLIFEYFEVDRGFILLQDSPDDRPDPVVVRHRLTPKDSKSTRITVSRTIVQHVLERSEGVLSSNAMADKRFSGGDSVQKYSIRSAMCVPLKFKDQCFGVIHIDSQIANCTYTEDQLRLLTAIGVQSGLALANARHYSERLQRERLVATGQTVASLSHSIKNILQGLRGGADVVELGMRKDSMKVVQGGWKIVARNLDRIFALTLNMLAFSKQRSPELEMTDIAKLMDEIAALVQTQFDKKGVALLTDYDPALPQVPIDPSGIHQAVLNLLNNALDATDPDTGAVSLRCDYQPADDTVRIVISDNGPGITPETVKRLFQPFHSTKGLKGTGLGLVVTKKIVEEHAGTITVDCPPERGTSFTLTLRCNVNEMNLPQNPDEDDPSLDPTLDEEQLLNSA